MIKVAADQLSRIKGVSGRPRSLGLCLVALIWTSGKYADVF